MKWNWQEQTILLTGGSSGIGRALANELGKKGSTIILVARNEDLLNETKLDLSKKHLDAKFDSIVGDVGLANDCEKIITFCIENYQNDLSMIINNAGVSQYGPIINFPEELVHKIFEINYFGPLRLIQGLVPLLSKRKIVQIVNVSSIAGERPMPKAGFYAGTKAALNSLSETLGMELDADPLLKHIKVVNVWPGVTETSIGTRTLLEDPQSRRKKVKLKGVVTADALAKSIIKHLSVPKNRRRIIAKRDRVVLFGNSHFRSIADYFAKKFR